MAYFLKKTISKKGTYLQIYESRWDPERRQTVHRSIRPVGYAEELAESEGLDNPIGHYREVVRGMNDERKRMAEEERAKARPEPERTGDVTPLTDTRGRGVAATRFSVLRRVPRPDLIHASGRHRFHGEFCDGTPAPS